VRSPNALFKGVIGDHALQKCFNKKCVCISFYGKEWLPFAGTGLDKQKKKEVKIMVE
jgi:hypothetical protein